MSAFQYKPRYKVGDEVLHKELSYESKFGPWFQCIRTKILDRAGSLSDKSGWIYKIQAKGGSYQWVGESSLMDILPEVRNVRLNPKSRPDWIPADVLLGMGDVLAWGKGKYPGNDWKSMSPDLHLAAAQRHLLKHSKGEQNDDESGMNHLYHAMVRLAFYTHLVTHEQKTL